MKIINLGASLSNILNEDNDLLLETSKNEQVVKSTLHSQTKEYEQEQEHKNELEYIHVVKDNLIRLIYSFFPLIELPLSLAAIIALFILNLNPINVMICCLIACGCILDSGYNIGNNYKKICNSESITKRIVNAIKRLLTKKKQLSNELESVKEHINTLESSIEELTKQLKDMTTKKEVLKEEIEAVEGYLLGINRIIDRKFIEEMPDDNLIVKFVDRKLKLKSGT